MQASVQTHPSKTSWLRRLSGEATSPRAVLAFPFAGADGKVFKDLGGAMPAATALYGVQLPGRGQRAAEPPAAAVRTVVDHVLAELSELSHVTDVALLGYSMGAPMAFETAVTLEKRGDVRLRKVVVAASRAPHIRGEIPPLEQVSDSELRSAIEKMGGTPREALEHPDFNRVLLPIIRADLHMLQQYQISDHGLLRCPLHVFAGMHDKVTPLDAVRAWGIHSVDTRVQIVDEAHFFLQQRQREFADAIAAAFSGPQ